MSDYISREAVFEAIKKKADEAVENHDADYASGLIDAISVVTHFPAADVAPMVPAKWILPDGDDDRPRCSNCDHIALADDDMYFLSNHCPNCGCKMKENKPMTNYERMCADKAFAASILSAAYYKADYEDDDYAPDIMEFLDAESEEQAND